MTTHGTKEELRAHVLASTRQHFAQGTMPSLTEIAQAAGISRTTFYRAFVSREELLEALSLEPEIASRERLLAKAVEMIGQEGLAALSMDLLADAAGVSRATVYRIFPRKAVLFREMIKTYAPFERLALLMEQIEDRPPNEVMPQVARLLVELLEERPGLFRTLAFEISSQQEDAEEAMLFALERGIGSLLLYLEQQMHAGVIRPIAPVVALQAFWGPLVIHLLTRTLAQRELGLTLSFDEVIEQFVAFWLRAMKVE